MGKLSDTKVSEKNLTTVSKPVRNFLDVGVGDSVAWHVEQGEVVETDRKPRHLRDSDEHIHERIDVVADAQ